MGNKTEYSTIDLVSIIIANYNSGTMLENCVKSIIKFTDRINYEIIVIDNNSIDESLNFISELNDNRIKLIKNFKNYGFARANNIGVSKALGKFVLLLNNDTLFIENSLEKILYFYKKLSKKSIVSCKLLNADKSLQRSTYNFPSLINTFASTFFLYKLFPNNKKMNKYYSMRNFREEIQEVDVVTGAFIFMEKEDFEELNGFDEDYFFFNEDTDLCYRFKKNIGKVYYFPNSSVIHYKGGSTKDNLQFIYENHFKSDLKFYSKHFSNYRAKLASFLFKFGYFLRIPIFFSFGLLSGNKLLIKRAKVYFNLIF